MATKKKKEPPVIISRFESATYLRDLRITYTVGDLIQELKRLPKSLKVGEFGRGCKIEWFNCGKYDEHAQIRNYEEDWDEEPYDDAD